MQHPLKPARTETYEHTQTGLLGKRRELLNEAERIRDRLAEIRNDIMALDRTLATLGYEGNLEAAMPRQKRHVIFGRENWFALSWTNYTAPEGLSEVRRSLRQSWPFKAMTRGIRNTLQT